MQNLRLIQITPEDLKTEINDAVSSSFKKLLQRDSLFNNDDKNFITRKDVKKMLHVCDSTITNWCKSGRLKKYCIGGKVLFLKDEVTKSLIQVN
ncbi:MAG: hypothetical protein RLY43_2351 [Bacteroidota bacterium]|jgi:hypothetical protein